MNAVLLDTDVFSYLMKPKDTRGQAYSPHVKGKTVAVCFITVGELWYGARKGNWGTKKIRDLEERLKAVVIVPYDSDLCKTYGRVRASLTQAGICVAPNDLWIASCAIRHAIPLISNNRKHFEKIPGLVLISEVPSTKAAAALPPNLELPFDSKPDGAGTTTPKPSTKEKKPRTPSAKKKPSAAQESPD